MTADLTSVHAPAICMTLFAETRARATLPCVGDSRYSGPGQALACVGGAGDVRRLTPFLAVCLLGCTTEYRAEITLPSDPASFSATPMVHCLESLGYEEHSADPMTREMQAENPTLVALWEPTVGGGYPFAPNARAFVYRLGSGWSVNFLPRNGGGDDSSYLAEAFARCVTLHDSDARVEVRSTTFPDFR
jgi:hypothetical protein